MRVAILTVSSSRTEASDASGDTLKRLATAAGMTVVERALVGDDLAALKDELVRLADRCDLLLTTGGTGITADDLTPEATEAVIDREVPGIAEALRARSLAHTPMAMLSRGVAGTRNGTLIVNLPGSPGACEQCFAVIEPVLAHARGLLARRR